MVLGIYLKRRKPVCFSIKQNFYSKQRMDRSSLKTQRFQSELAKRRSAHDL